MEQIEIKKETLPQRCEICHQADCFDSLANYCRRCSSVSRPTEPISISKKVSQEYFFTVSIPKLVVMSIFTLNLYQLYWFYKNWDLIDDRKRMSVRPALRAIFSVIFCYSLFKNIKKTAKELGVETNLIASLSAVVFIFFRIIEKLPDAFCLLSLLSFIPLIFVQRLINKIHLQYAPGIPINDKFSKSNVAVIIVGGFFIVLALFSFFVPESE